LALHAAAAVRFVELVILLIIIKVTLFVLLSAWLLLMELYRHDGFLLGAFAGRELQQLFVEGVVFNFAVLVLEEDVEKLAEVSEWVGGASLALGRLEIVVRLGVGAMVRLNDK
jgi:hypothetical protein